MSFEQCKKVASAYMQVVRKVFYRNIRTGIAQDIGGSLGDIEIIIRFQGVIGSVGSFAKIAYRPLWIWHSFAGVFS